MSELDTRLAALRDELHSSLTPPDLGHVTGRARQRSVRRRMQVAAVAAVVAVSVAVPVLRSLPGDDHQPAEPPPSKPLSYEVDFADPQHGYALGRDCDEPDGPCTYALRVTTDGGRTWADRELPQESGTYEVVELTVLGPDEVIFHRVAAGGQEGGLERAFSSDGGRTWRDVGFGGDLAAPRPFDRGAHTSPICLGADADGDCVMGVGATISDTAGTAPAPAQPPLVEIQAGTTATAGGRYWAAGHDPATGRWGLAVTSDRGATWSTSLLDVPGEPALADAWSVVERDGDLFATVIGTIERGPTGLLAVFRSTDGGKSWTRTWAPEGSAVLQAVFGGAVATADGALLVYSTVGGTLASTDGGRTFHRAEQQLPGPVTWTRGGYLVTRGDGSFDLSSDGLHWRTFDFG